MRVLVAQYGGSQNWEEVPIGAMGNGLSKQFAREIANNLSRCPRTVYELACRTMPDDGWSDGKSLSGVAVVDVPLDGEFFDVMADIYEASMAVREEAESHRKEKESEVAT